MRILVIEDDREAAAYLVKALDEIISRFSDIVFSFPAVLMGLLITAIVGPGEFAAICAIILVTLPPIVRVVRAAAMEVTGTDYVTIAWLSGASPARLLLVNVLPNISVPVVTQVAYSISIGMLVESLVFERLEKNMLRKWRASTQEGDAV